MLYKFKCKASGDLIMLQPDGRRLLEIIGKLKPSDDDVSAAKGILQPEQMALAISALLGAIAAEQAEQQAASAQTPNGTGAAARSETISLRRRAQPMLAMLRAAQAAGQPVVWGV